jgi:hypothetical protein
VESEWSRKRVRWALSKAIGPALLAAATFGLSCSGDRFSTAPQTAGFWFERSSLELPSAATHRLGGPLTADELRSIKDLSRSEIDHAFSNLRIAVTESPNAFWRVEVIQSSPVKWTRQLPSAGESVALGVLGGHGAVVFDIVALKAIHYAPTDGSRESIIDAIGRGIGRVAVHEFVHQILGVAASHNDGDENSYEYGSPDRPSQYYGELHWTTSWPLLASKFGTDSRQTRR